MRWLIAIAQRRREASDYLPAFVLQVPGGSVQTQRYGFVCDGPFKAARDPGWRSSDIDKIAIMPVDDICVRRLTGLLSPENDRNSMQKSIHNPETSPRPERGHVRMIVKG